jgi:eukaryotic-like serine/threonine-protein kinase
MKPTILNQRYRLNDLVGAGGMATVYRGEDLLLERPVAVKFLREPYANDPAARRRFLQEARAAAKLDHPNVVHIYDVGQDEGDHPYIVMDLMEGQDLKALIRRDGPLTIPHALTLARQICAGVGQAHRAGIVHCDLKPQNILVTEGRRVKVTDFGIARAVRQEAERPDLDSMATPSSEKVVWGSPHYLSPEQGLGRTPTPASDVYSIGVILYEMLAGVPPFHDSNPTALIRMHVQEVPAPVSSLNPRVPSGLDRLVRKVLAKDPAARFKDADAFGVAIDEYVRQGQGGTYPYGAVAEETPVVDMHPPGRGRASQAPKSEVSVLPEGGTEPVDLDEGPDLLLWGLLGIAAVAVIGLIPLWAYVYQAYTAPAGRPTPVMPETTATVTATAEAVVTVPNLMGLSAADAQRMAESLGLEIEVLGEQETTDARPGAILEQTPGPGNRVPISSTVSVVLAAGRALTMPDVVGYSLDTVQEGLENEGLLLQIQEVRDTEAAGTILEQEPEPDSQIRVGSPVTLTVSGGSDVAIAINANLDDRVVLEQAWVSQFSYRPGGSVPVTLRWRCLESFDSSYKVFVHVLTQDMERLIAQRDVEPVNGLRPTQTWTRGELISDAHQVMLPADTPAGTYQIRVGLYNEQGRLPVVDPGQADVVDDTIFITSIEVTP